MAFRRDSAAAGPAGRFLRLPGDWPGDWEEEDGAPSRAGWTVSAVGHVGLLAFLLFGGVFGGEPLPPLEVAEVTVISEEEFALLTRPQETPEAGEGVTAPEIPQAPAEAPPPPAPRPEVAETPEAPEPAPPAPVELTAPPPVEAAPDPPAPAPAPRVATEAAPEPPVEAEEAPVAVEETAPAETPPETVVEEQAPAAPAEAAPEIVTEAERPSGVPDATPRPLARPDRIARLDPGRTVEATSEPVEREAAPVPEATPETPPEVAQPAQTPDDAMAAAIAGAVADAISNTPQGAPQTGAAAGPPLSQGEQDAFRISVQRCWIVDPGSPAASVTVVVGMRLTRDAKPDTASINLLGTRGGGDDGAVRAAYEAARRAILRCGAEGFPLPPEKYERWAEVEMTFNPEEMRIR